MIDLQEVAKKKKKKNYREVLCTLSSVSPIGNTLQVQDQKKLGFKMKLAQLGRWDNHSLFLEDPRMNLHRYKANQGTTIQVSCQG